MEILNEVEVRVLGSLIEKDITTPEYYPLSLNSLIAACNQKSNRDPVMELEEEAVREALSSLAEKRLAGPVNSAESRVTKYEHRMQEVFNLTRAETAVLCVLLLRGPQTPGELRGRTERMHAFAELGDVVGTLQRLMQRPEPLVSLLPRQPGTKESRYAHLLSGTPATTAAPLPSPEESPGRTRIEGLEAEVKEIRQTLEELQRQFNEFRRQFES